MEIKIIEKKENPLLNRTEIKFECEYPTDCLLYTSRCV